MSRTIIAKKILRDLNKLAISIRMNEVRVRATYARLSRESSLEFGEITPTGALVLEVIGTTPNVNGQYIADQIGMTKGGASKILNRLQEKGLINGKKDDADYKSIFYSLTDIGYKARAFHEKLLSVASAEIQDLISSSSDEEIIAIQGFITGMVERFGNISKNLENVTACIDAIK